MPIFRYTFKKMIISPSTWILFALSLSMLGLAWSIIIASSGNESNLNQTLPVWKLLSFSIFISLMLLVFIAVKATQIFRDEIDDGTLLILVSKPISRTRIWAEKWLAFQIMIVSFIFFTIFLDGLLLIIPGIGNSSIYLKFLPYMGILFAISLLFALIFNSIILLLSLIVNGKATIAIVIIFAALTNIFSTAVDPLVVIPQEYFTISQAVAVFHDLEKKVSSSEIDWLKEQKEESYLENISSIMNQVYRTNISDVSYPREYDFAKEQIAVKSIIETAKGSDGTAYSDSDVALLNHISYFANIFRQSKEQPYEELMTSRSIGPWGSHSSVQYSPYNVIEGLNIKISDSDVNYFNSKIHQKKVMRYFNIFYQLYYLWTGAWNDNNSLYTSQYTYAEYNDPYLISFNNSKEGDGNIVNISSGTGKIINFTGLASFYVTLGLILLIVSWYVFNRRDFT